ILAIAPDNLEVARGLLPIYEESGNWSRLLSTNEVLLAAAGDDVAARLEIIREQVRIAGEHLKSPAQSLNWAAKAYELAPDDDSVRELLEAAVERSDGWDELTRLYEARIAQEGTSEEDQLALLDKLAVIARDRLF